MIEFEDSISIRDKINLLKQRGFSSITAYELTQGYIAAVDYAGNDFKITKDRNYLSNAVKAAIGSSGGSSPLAPVLTLPADGATGIGISPLLKWGTSAGADAYRVQIATNPSYLTTVVDQSSISSTSYQVSALSPRTTYYWRVIAYGPGGTSPWSSTRSFTTGSFIGLKGQLFFDKNSNGTRDAQEEGMCGWTVTLSGAANASTLTDSSGFYSFDDIASGSYTLTLPLPTFWAATTPSSVNVIVGTSTPPDVNFGLFSSLAMAVSIDKSWNIVSVPVRLADFSSNAIFPLALTPVYAYNQVYISMDTLSNGPAYWVKFPFDSRVWIAGQKVTSITVPVATGWNFVGSVSDTVPVERISTNPAGILSPAVYGYDHGNVLVDVLEPGKGYWVLATGDGTVSVTSTSLASPMNVRHEAIMASLNALNTVTFESQDGDKQTLFVAVDPALGHLASSYQLPPPPPAGVFDIRFAPDRTGSNGSMGRILTKLGSSSISLPLQLRSAPSSLKVSWNMQDNSHAFELLTSSGSPISLVGSGNTQLQLGNTPGAVSLSIRVNGDGSSGVPSAFALHQNYPNPFNSGTMLNFSVPVESVVRLEVFNVLGQSVALVADRQMQPGEYSLPFDASKLPSGVYLARLSAAGENVAPFSAITRMLLLR